MPPRAKPAAYHPPPEYGTFRDLLLFEERLKTNNARLKKQKARYQFFFLVLLVCIALLTSDLLLHTFFTPYVVNLALKAEHPLWDPVWTPHPYVTPGLLLIASTTLILFFASGMYAEKIGYANRYVPSANRALRSFNMYFNIRSPSMFPYPLSLLFQPPPAAPSHPSTPATLTIPSLQPSSRSPLQPLPPSSNPRGELIFSSRIPPSFRDAYESYRAGFERRRAKRSQAQRWYYLPFLRAKGAAGGKDEGAEEQEGERRGGRDRSPSIVSSLAPTPDSSRLPSRSPSPAVDVSDREGRERERIPSLIQGSQARRRSARIARRLEGVERDP
ncbi:hypothetical protein CALVIDRAFT_561281 [Calocera viscosa TUFC12733]|uniref:Transmembrane protein 188 n=1 Tax=Calocera viscosa (strain TUFC12733) TaxID=1330018 RepID=A0A167Q543_CALVF|nr:hypothetical protein CALVIDRAFT_561281 [Calocera viscosa TUFC12733]